MNKIVLLVAALALVTLVTLPIQTDAAKIPASTTETSYKQPNFYTVGDCDDICPMTPNTVCKLDCWIGEDDAEECKNNFYDKDGNLVHHCWE